MRRYRVAALAVIASLVMLALVRGVSAQEQINAPTAVGQSTSISWSGTVLPGTNTSSECGQPTDVGAHTHEAVLVVPDGLYDSLTVTAVATATYSGPTDIIITIVAADGQTASGDNGFIDTDESATMVNPAAGTIRVITCMFAGVLPQAYSGTLTLTASAGPPPATASCGAPPKPLRFSTPTYVDTDRAGGEPSIQSLADGSLLYAAHAGTTHFYSLEADDPDSAAFAENYRGQVHAWYSDNGGASWNFVDRTLPPDNAPGSGFSDPDFAIDGAGNVYLSEINLANVAVSKSTTNGRSYHLQNFFAMTVTDRQWKTAGPANVLFMVGNASEGGTVPTDPVGNSGHLIYRSTDGGQTFSEATQDDGGLGDIIYDPTSSTVYEAHYDGGSLQMAAFRQALDPDVTTALTPDLITIATGVGMAAHWPAIDVDAKGNVYIVWDETGNGERDAGVYYSYSTDGARTWAPPTRVDPDDRTDLWPWIAVGSPGRVAIAWMGNDNKLPGNDPEQAGPNDPWNVYVAQTLNGLGCSSSDSPGFRSIKATPQPFHTATVCTGGTICQAELVDRRLGDYMTIDIDTQGNLVAAYSDTRQGGAVALPAFLKQTGGTIFFKGKPPGK